jgi:SAM-dependent methyltransferase
VSDPQGLAFDSLAEDYDVGRSGWPPEVLEGIDGDTVLDLAAGTGKLTALLVERYAEVIAVEPLAGMRAVLERNVPGVEAISGSAEGIPLEDASVDAVFVAEAFHWFDSSTAVAEIARVLRPGGTLLVCFNDWLASFDPAPPDEFRPALDEVRGTLPPRGGPKVQSGAWKLGFEGAPFSPLEHRSFRHEWSTSRRGVAAYYVSTSSMGNLDPADRETLRERLVALLPDVRHDLSLEAQVFTAVRA